MSVYHLGMKLLLAFLAMGVLSACQQQPIRDEDSPWARIQPGSKIILHQTLTVPPGHARVFMQGGEVVAKVRLNQYLPHCNFETHSVSDGTLRIEADTFLVTNTYEGEEEVVFRNRPLRYVAWSWNGKDYNDPGMINLLVHHDLNSPNQPQVMRLTCHAGLTEIWEAHYPSISDIRHAMGSIATLELVQP